MREGKQAGLRIICWQLFLIYTANPILILEFWKCKCHAMQQAKIQCLFFGSITWHLKIGNFREYCEESCTSQFSWHNFCLCQTLSSGFCQTTSSRDIPPVTEVQRANRYLPKIFKTRGSSFMFCLYQDLQEMWLWEFKRKKCSRGFDVGNFSM